MKGTAFDDSPTPARQIGPHHRRRAARGASDCAGAGAGRGGCGDYLPQFAVRGWRDRPRNRKPGTARASRRLRCALRGLGALRLSRMLLAVLGVWIFWSTMPPSLTPLRWTRSRSSSGMRSSRPMRAGRFWWRARRCRICALLRGGSSTSARWAGCTPGPDMRTTAPRRPRCTRSPSRWPRPLRREVSVNCVAPGWIELEEQRCRAGRALCAEDADAAQWKRGGRSAGGALLCHRAAALSPGRCWPSMAGWGFKNREQGTGNREQGTGNREQGIGNREQGTGNRE